MKPSSATLAPEQEQETIEEVKTKKYVLLPHTEPTANIFQMISATERAKLNKRPNDNAYLQMTFTDEKGKQRTIRLKLNCDTIYQDEQIKLGILANERFTDEERKAVEFKQGQLITSIPIVQKFLEASPQFAGFKGRSKERPLYMLDDAAEKRKERNKDTAKRVQAATIIVNIKDLKKAQELMIRLNGSFFKTPDDLEVCKEDLMGFVDEADTAMLDRIISNEITADEETMILVGKLVNAEVISFDDVPNQVAKKSGNGWNNLKQISSDLEPEERQNLFVEHLNSPEGKSLLDALKDEMKKIEKAAK